MPFYFDPDNYDALLEKKVEHITQLLSEFEHPEIQVHSSPKQHFRMRAEFRMWHDKDTDHPSPYPAMFDRETKKPQRVNNFPIASEVIDKIVQKLPVALQPFEHLKNRLFQMECLSSQSGDVVLTLIYHRPLDQDWEDQAKSLAQELNVHIVGRSRKQKVIIGQDFIDETFATEQGDLRYKQLENTFTQPNAVMNTAMLSWVLDQTKNIAGDALELYCGNGNFTIALAKNFRRVFATEMVKSAVKTALENAQLNNLDNCEIVRMSSEEFTQAIQGVREFRRLKEVDLASYEFSTILVDPPRSGLDVETCKQIQVYDNIVYISCNPNTLCENLKTLTQTHKITSTAAFDQFPYTDHLESAVFLKKRSS